MRPFIDDEGLAGDLEELRAGRSRLWYGRQLLLAVAVSALRRTDVYDLFAAKGMVMQSVMLALISVCAVFTVKMILLFTQNEEIVRTLIGPSVLRELFRVAASFAVAVAAGAVIAWLHDRSRTAAVVAFSTTVPLWAFANLVLLDGDGTLDAALPHVAALLVFVMGLLAGGLHTRRPAL
jgi:hypothetical protein